MSSEKSFPSHEVFLTSLNNIHMITTISEVLSNENGRQAMTIGMRALEKSKTWELVDLSVGKKVSGM